MENIRTFINKHGALLICGSGFMLCFIAYYPGFLSPDSFDQYHQALTGNYEDWHPPIMAGLWRLFNHIHQGPQLMLAFQLGCLWISVFLLMQLIPKLRWKIIILLFALAPFVQNFAGYIVKDSQMALSWLLAFTLMLHYAFYKKRIPVVIAIVIFLLLMYGGWVRTNAFPGVLPFCIWYVWLIFPTKSNLLKSAAAVLFIGFLATGHWIQDIVFKTEKTYPEYKLYLQSITGIYVSTGENYFPNFLNEHKGFDTTLLKQDYLPATFDDIILIDTMISIPEGDENTAPVMKQACIKAISAHPFVFLPNRLDGYLYYLRIKNRARELTAYYPQVSENTYGFSFHENVISKLFLNPIKWQTSLPYMKPWFWFFLNFILLFFIRGFKNRAFQQGFAVLVFSGIFYQALMFLVFPTDTDFRYFYWNCIACFIAVCLWLGDRWVEELRVESYELNEFNHTLFHY